MASIVISGDTSGSVTLSAPAVAGSTTQTLVNVTGTLAPLVSGTAVASTSGTSIDFTGIPSWVKRITVMFNGISLSGTASALIQIGSGSVTTTGYLGSATVQYNTAVEIIGSTSGFLCPLGASVRVIHGALILTLISGNTWVSSGSFGFSNAAASASSGGTGVISGALDRVRITTTNGTDTFDLGSINILYE